MEIVADLHIHSRFSAATSEDMRISALVYYGKIKGLDLIGTGDAVHPKWIQELEEELMQEEGGLYVSKSASESPRFMPTVEVATVFEYEGKSRRIHHLILLPSLDEAKQLSDVLKTKGNIEQDGRPTLNITAAELIDLTLSVSNEVEVIPAHIWTPWWSLFGSVSGFNLVEECYQDRVDKIHALETGLSSDPLMNWRLSRLDKYLLVSNSDSHSPLPHRLGREANVFELTNLSYKEIINAIRKIGRSKLKYTIETYPQYGKYHWTGHRACNISMPPQDAIKLKGICPKCGKKMTLGVEQRVEELADRALGYKPEGSPDYKYMLPLEEIIGSAVGASTFSKAVQTKYKMLIESFGSEFRAAFQAPYEAISKIAGVEVASALKAVRENTVQIKPGFDGVYGEIEFPQLKEKKKLKGTLDDWS
ncbi:MAG: endonuclease Q family protein [Nitrososphaerales archaeon]